VYIGSVKPRAPFGSYQWALPEIMGAAFLDRLAGLVAGEVAGEVDEGRYQTGEVQRHLGCVGGENWLFLTAIVRYMISGGKEVMFVFQVHEHLQ
jgi:hypothetical protein